MGYLRSIEGNRQKKGTGALKTALGRYAKSVTTVGRNGRAQGMA